MRFKNEYAGGVALDERRLLYAVFRRMCLVNRCGPLSRFHLPLLWCCALLCLLALPLLPHSPPARAAGPWYVTPNGDDANTCLTPATPCASIDAALNKPAFAPGDTILVAAGIYMGGSNLAPVVCLNKDAALSGGWDSTFAAQNGETVITAEHSLAGVIVAPDVTASMDRFTLTGFSFLYTNGASSLRSRAAPIVFGEQESETHAPLALAGDACTFGLENPIDNRGNFTLSHSVVVNSESSGISNSSVFTLSDSLVTGNYSNGVRSDGTMTIYRSTISNNFGGCGGINNQGYLLVVSSTISYNSTRFNGYGGGMCNRGDAALVNTTVSLNSTQGVVDKDGGLGGGIYNISGTLSLYNATVSYNAATRGGGYLQ